MMGHLEALAEIALALSLLMTIAWLVQQRTGNSGWVDTIWTFSVGMTGAVADRRRRAQPAAMADRGIGGAVGAAAGIAYRAAVGKHIRRSPPPRPRPGMGGGHAPPDAP